MIGELERLKIGRKFHIDDIINSILHLYSMVCMKHKTFEDINNKENFYEMCNKLLDLDNINIIEVRNDIIRNRYFSEDSSLMAKLITSNYIRYNKK